MMAWGQPGSNAMLGILKRVAGPVQGPQLHKLSVATIRSVATGVLCVAFIQGLLFGIGFLMADSSVAIGSGCFQPCGSADGPPGCCCPQPDQRHHTTM